MPIHTAKAAAGEGAKVIYLSPQGRKLDQAGVSELATNQKLILVCGRYEGIDERVIQTEIDEEWSIGDYVLSGGELPAMTLIDSVSRFIPGGSGVMRHRQRKIPLPMDCWTVHTIPVLKC
ncbi:tRNA (guanine-N(1)-)-methyltransferase [Raoultella planticola]|uniref:tRNA (Guanine-N(1)-)-methyltransferase n=1 Tax=Raoultella planticola TaxID=575 RepID=A0A485BV65_RAOPL|nr:tRNA (guanine-N(1)-)-methyltransferase [Raoultella planticola]